MKIQEIIKLLYLNEYLYFVIGNYLINTHDLIVHYVSDH